VTVRVVDARRVMLLALALGAAAAAVVAAAAGARAGGSVLVGAAFLTGDVYLIRLLVSRLMAGGAGSGLALVLLTLKFFLVVAAAAALFAYCGVAPMPFAAGATALLAAAVLEAACFGPPAGGGEES